MAQRLVEASDEFYDATADLSALHEAIVEFDQNEARGLQSLDLFSGKGAYCNTCNDAGLECRAVDIAHDGIRENILCKEGFHYILRLVCSIDSSLSEHVCFWMEGYI